LATRGVVGIRCLQFATLDGILGCVGADVGLTLLPKELSRRQRTKAG
jgi:hypothetical protein